MTGPAGANGAAGAPGASGAAGPKGTDGTKGAEGREGESAFTNIVVRTDTIENLSSGSAIVHCHPGETAIAGGAEAGNFSNGAKLFATTPTVGEVLATNGETPTGWVTGVETTGGAKTTTFSAVCAS